MAMKLAAALCLVPLAAAWPQDAGSNQTQEISLAVPQGTPLRVYLTKRVSKRPGAPVEAKLLVPLYAFDHEVIPAGTQVLGRVSSVVPVSKWDRIRSMLGGDFTPLHIARIEFASVIPPGGSPVELHTFEPPELNSLVPVQPPRQRTRNNAPAGNTGIVSAGKQKAREAIEAEIARIKGVPALVRGPGKKEWLYDYAMSRLPYHPQYVRNRTRFDAELSSPLNFGSETASRDSLKLLGSQPNPGSIAHARLLTALDSTTSTQGEKVEAILEQPLFSADHKLVLPEGTLVHGSVSMAKKAGWFHRGGRLRFDFQSVDWTPRTAEPAARHESAASQAATALQLRTQATLDAAESADAPIKVDKEGGVEAKESKTRFIGTALAALAASRAADNDPIRAPGGPVGHRQNVAGRTLGGGIGFGMLGSIASQSSRTVGVAFGYYGLAWSLYATVIARGQEVKFGKNAAIDVAFNQRTADAATKK
jgi:hypothetical protein